MFTSVFWMSIKKQHQTFHGECGTSSNDFFFKRKIIRLYDYTYRMFKFKNVFYCSSNKPTLQNKIVNIQYLIFFSQKADYWVTYKAILV